MPATKTQIQCPNCQSPIQASIEQLLDVGEDPSIKGRLLSGSLNRIQCPTCGYEGQIASPLIYHDPEKELLLTFMPPQIDMNKDEQEKMIGKMINQIVDRLPQEERKAYLLQPKSVLTMQGLAEQVLEADGVSKEEIEEQQAKLRLFEQLIRTPEDRLEEFVQDHDEELDEAFFQLASLALQSVGDQRTLAAASQRLDQALRLSTVGEQLEAQETELRQAAEELRELGDGLTREKLLDLVIEATSDERIVALVNLARQAMDYAFFQALSDRIDQAQGDERAELEQLRERLLEITQEIDEYQQARANQATGLLRSLLEAEDLDAALQSVLPMIDELFLGTLEANLVAAREQGNEQAAQKLERIQSKLTDHIQQSMPRSLQLAQQVLDEQDIEKAKRLRLSEPFELRQVVLNALLGATRRMEESDQPEHAERIRALHRHAARISMRRKMKETEESQG